MGRWIWWLCYNNGVLLSSHVSFECGLQALNYDFRKMSESCAWHEMVLGFGFFLWSLELAMEARQAGCGIGARPSVSLGLFSSPLTNGFWNSSGIFRDCWLHTGWIGRLWPFCNTQLRFPVHIIMCFVRGPSGSLYSESLLFKVLRTLWLFLKPCCTISRAS